MKQLNAAGKWWIHSLAVILLLLFSHSLFAQKSTVKTVTGRVIASRSDSAVAEASIW